MNAMKDMKLEETDAVTVTLSIRAGHSDQVLQWRLDQWSRLGYKHQRALFLADTRIDIEQARRMVSGGCPLDLVEEILLGTCFAGEDELWYREPVVAEVEEEVEDDEAA